MRRALGLALAVTMVLPGGVAAQVALDREGWCDLYVGLSLATAGEWDPDDGWDSVPDDEVSICVDVLTFIEEQGFVREEAEAPRENAVSYLVDAWSGTKSVDTAAFRLVTGDYRAEISADAGAKHPCTHISHLSPTEGLGYDANASFFLDKGERDSVTTYVHGIDGGPYYWSVNSSCDWEIRLYRE